MTAWQREDVARRFIEERRAFVPYGADQLRMMLQLVEHFVPRPRRILDLGCGDGTVARVLLEAYPDARAVLLDNSEPMLEAAREAMAPFATRCEICAADLNASLPAFSASSASSAVNHPKEHFDVVVSGYAIHHLPHHRKRSLYAEIHEALVPGGLFVNLEHVASPSRRVEELLEKLYIDHISTAGGKPRDQVHAEYYGRPDKADNILELVEVQVAWLREIGFENADCYFKWLELAVFGGTKRAG
jgi:tRNA (cmo5U34)-methyltransferase